MLKGFPRGGFPISVLLDVLQLFIPVYAELCDDIAVTSGTVRELGGSQILHVIGTKDVWRENLKYACS